jgi:predicted nuclease of predicted toxin-antitoxin system
VSPLADPSNRLLLDENLAARIVETLAETYPGSVHVQEAGFLALA